MASTALIKALEGDEYSLVLFTERVQFNTISPTDLKHIMKQKSKVENLHAQYLYAFCLATGRGCDADVKSAKTILKQLAARDNSFAANLLQSSFFHDNYHEEINLLNYIYVLDVKGHELRNNQPVILTEKLNRAKSLLQNLAEKMNPDKQNKAGYNL